MHILVQGQRSLGTAQQPGGERLLPFLLYSGLSALDEAHPHWGGQIRCEPHPEAPHRCTQNVVWHTAWCPWSSQAASDISPYKSLPTLRLLWHCLQQPCFHRCLCSGLPRGLFRPGILTVSKALFRNVLMWCPRLQFNQKAWSPRECLWCSARSGWGRQDGRHMLTQGPLHLPGLRRSHPPCSPLFVPPTGPGRLHNGGRSKWAPLTSLLGLLAAPVLGLPGLPGSCQLKFLGRLSPRPSSFSVPSADPTVALVLPTLQGLWET